MLLAWSETGSGTNTIARLRARARKLEYASIVVFATAVGALIVGAISFVQVGDLVAAEVEKVEEARTKQQLARQGGESSVSRSEVLASTIRRYAQLIEGQKEEVRRLELELDEGFLQYVSDDDQRRVLHKDYVNRVGQASEARGLTEAFGNWKALEEERFEAEMQYENAPSDSKEEKAAETQRKAADQKIKDLRDQNKELGQVIDSIDEAIDDERNELIRKRRDALNRIEQLETVRNRVEQEKIEYDVQNILTNGGAAEPSPQMEKRESGQGAAPDPTTTDPGSKAPRDAKSSKSSKSLQGARGAPLDDPASGANDGAGAQASPRGGDGALGGGGGPPGDDAKTGGDAKPNADGDSTFESFDWQVNLTRTGISIFTLFLVQMLLGLQRYITRLATFYHGRADALELMNRADGPGVFSALDGVTMEDRRELLDRMSPMTVDYAKAQAPSKDIVDLAKTIVANNTRRNTTPPDRDER